MANREVNFLITAGIIYFLITLFIFFLQPIGVMGLYILFFGTIANIFLFISISKILSKILNTNAIFVAFIILLADVTLYFLWYYYLKIGSIFWLPIYVIISPLQLIFDFFI